MNIVWIVADTFRKDHLGCYGNRTIHTPALDGLASEATVFDKHYIGAFPTMPTRADHATGRWTMSFMGWEPLPSEVTTLSELMAAFGYHTAAVVDTPFYWRKGFNYDKGFQTFFPILGQEGSASRVRQAGNHESRDIVAWWRKESDRNVARTMTQAGDWLERHYDEDFFLYVDTWDPHEPWDAPEYYTKLYLPEYDGEIVQPPYYRWQDVPGMTSDIVQKAHATYCGEITMVDTWIGYLLRKLQNLGLLSNTAIIFTSDHGFYFGEHGGRFGKMTFDRKSDGGLYTIGEENSRWAHSPLYEEVCSIPLIFYVPDETPKRFAGISSAIDVMPTVLDLVGHPIPGFVDGRSLSNVLRGGDGDASSGRDYTVSTIPFANRGDEVRSVDNVARRLAAAVVTTVTTQQWSLIYSTEPGMSELYDLSADPKQERNVIHHRDDVARDIHKLLTGFIRDVGMPERLAEPRLELRL